MSWLVEQNVAIHSKAKIIGGFREGTERFAPPPPPLFDLFFLYFETLTSFHCAFRIRPQCCKLHVRELSRVGAVVRALASHQCVPGSISWTGRHMWVEFVVGSLLCSERFFSGYSGFPISLKTNISKFQFDSGTYGHFCTSSCELLSAPWVNKLHFHFLCMSWKVKFHPRGGGG